MDNFLKIFDADGRKYDVPVDIADRGRMFVAEHPMLAEDLNVTEVRLISDNLDCPIRFVLESFRLVGEAGHWSITIREDDLGIPEYHLEYYATKYFDRKSKNSPVMQWDHVKEEMTGD